MAWFTSPRRVWPRALRLCARGAFRASLRRPDVPGRSFEIRSFRARLPRSWPGRLQRRRRSAPNLVLRPTRPPDTAVESARPAQSGRVVRAIVLGTRSRALITSGGESTIVGVGDRWATPSSRIFPLRACACRTAQRSCWTGSARERALAVPVALALALAMPGAAAHRASRSTCAMRRW